MYILLCRLQNLLRFFSPFQSTYAAGEHAGHHAETDPPELHRHAGLRLGTHGPVVHARPRFPKRLPRRLGKCGRTPETHHGAGWRAPRWRAPQTGPDHLHSHVPTALPVGAAHCVLHQLPAPELFLRLHAI